MTFPAPPFVGLLYYAVTIAAFGIVAWLCIRQRKLSALDADQRKLFAGLRNRYWLAIVSILIIWIVAQVLLAEFAPGLPRLNP